MYLRQSYVAATKINLLMLLRETHTVYCNNHIKHTNTRIVYEQNSQFPYVKEGGIYSNYWTLRNQDREHLSWNNVLRTDRYLCKI
jgi:hypothetical protein